MIKKTYFAVIISLIYIMEALCVEGQHVLYSPINFIKIYAKMLALKTKFRLFRDAPLDFKGGEQEVWVRTSFFFSSSLARKVFFIFST